MTSVDENHLFVHRMEANRLNEFQADVLYLTREFKRVILRDYLAGDHIWLRVLSMLRNRNVVRIPRYVANHPRKQPVY